MRSIDDEYLRASLKEAGEVYRFFCEMSMRAEGASGGLFVSRDALRGGRFASLRVERVEGVGELRIGGFRD